MNMFHVRRIALIVLGLLACALDSGAVGFQRGEALPGTAQSDKKQAEPTPKQLALAEAIGKGHSYEKHVVEAKEFPEIKTHDEFIKKIANVIANPTHSKKLASDREAFYDQPSNTIVIVNPKTKDKGTCFRPSAGKRYYDNLK
jgi:pyocin large subunit-like protein